MDVRLDAEIAEGTVAFGIISFAGQHDADADYDGKGGQEQALEQDSVVHVRRGRYAYDGDAIPVRRDVACRVVPAAVSGIDPASSPSHLVRTEQLPKIRIGLPRNMAIRKACTFPSRLVRVQRAKARCRIEPPVLFSPIRRLRHRVPSRRNWRRVACTRTVSAEGYFGAGLPDFSQHSVTVAIRSEIRVFKAVLISALGRLIESQIHSIKNSCENHILSKK